MVPAARLELARPCERQILSLLCLPFHQAGTLLKTLTFRCVSIKRQVKNFTPLERRAARFLPTHAPA